MTVGRDFYVREAATAFPQSSFFPFAVGFLGLGTCYFVWGGQTVFGFPRAEGDARLGVERTSGLWGIWMGGFMQFITGVWLFTGLTWFPVFTGNAAKTPVYMAALAFTAYGVHWFVLGHRRFIGASALPDAWMSIAYAWLSIIGVIVFARANDIPVMLVFVGLALVYLSVRTDRSQTDLVTSSAPTIRVHKPIWLQQSPEPCRGKEMAGIVFETGLMSGRELATRPRSGCT